MENIYKKKFEQDFGTPTQEVLDQLKQFINDERKKEEKHNKFFNTKIDYWNQRLKDKKYIDDKVNVKIGLLPTAKPDEIKKSRETYDLNNKNRGLTVASLEKEVIDDIKSQIKHHIDTKNEQYKLAKFDMSTEDRAWEKLYNEMSSNKKIKDAYKKFNKNLNQPRLTDKQNMLNLLELLKNTPENKIENDVLKRFFVDYGYLNSHTNGDKNEFDMASMLHNIHRKFLPSKHKGTSESPHRGVTVNKCQCGFGYSYDSND